MQTQLLTTAAARLAVPQHHAKKPHSSTCASLTPAAAALYAINATPFATPLVTPVVTPHVAPLARQERNVKNGWAGLKQCAHSPGVVAALCSRKS